MYPWRHVRRMCCANRGWHAGGQNYVTHLSFSVNDELAGGRRVLNPNDDGGVDGLSQGARHGRSHVPVIPEGFAVKPILDMRYRMLVGLVI